MGGVGAGWRRGCEGNIAVRRHFRCYPFQKKSFELLSPPPFSPAALCNTVVRITKEKATPRRRRSYFGDASRTGDTPHCGEPVRFGEPRVEAPMLRRRREGERDVLLFALGEGELS